MSEWLSDPFVRSLVAMAIIILVLWAFLGDHED